MERVSTGQRGLRGHTTWSLLHSVIPQGTSAECDYLSIALYPGAPPKPGGLDKIDALLKKAGLTMSAQEFVDHRSSLTELVSNDLFQNQISVGTMKRATTSWSIT